MRVPDHIAMVTGGVRGLGAATAEMLLENGATVIACDISAEQARAWQEAMQAKGFTRTDYCIADVADYNACEQAVARVAEKWGRIDILVNNAGITRDKTLAKMELSQWQDVINTNLNSMYNVTRQVLPLMSAQQYGRIINISSVVGLIGNFGQTNYASAKAGILGFTKSLALEVARKGITVNAVCPGFIKTEMTAAMPRQAIDNINALIPIGYMGQPADIARAVLFLAEASASYITGTEIHINGGFYR